MVKLEDEERFAEFMAQSQRGRDWAPQQESAVPNVVFTAGMSEEEITNGMLRLQAAVREAKWLPSASSDWEKLESYRREQKAIAAGERSDVLDAFAELSRKSTKAGA